MTQKETTPVVHNSTEPEDLRKKEPIVQDRWWEAKPQDVLLPVMLVLKLPRIATELQRSEKYDLMNAAVNEKVAKINEYMAARPDIFAEPTPRIISTTFGMLVCRFTAAQCGVLADEVLKEKSTRGILIDSTTVGAEALVDELALQLADEPDDE